MKIITKAQIKLIHTLMSQYAKHRGFGIDKPEKESFVLECSEGRCTSTKSLTQKEAKVMIESLQNMLRSTENWLDGDRKRKRIIYYAYQMGWTSDHRPRTMVRQAHHDIRQAHHDIRQAHHDDRPPTVDMERINNWCIQYGYLHKPLMEYSNQELGKLVQQFHKMYVAFLKSF